MDIQLTNKTAVVCGASSGIGEASARICHALGAKVILLARREDKLKAIASSLENAEIVACDLANTDALQSQMHSLISRHGPIEILINNAGGPPPGLAQEATQEAIQAALAPHLFASMTLTESLLPGMREKHYGRIINVISTSVRTPIPGLGVSNIVRGAVANWAKTLSREVARDGITVNCVLPGATNTERLNGIIAAKMNKTNRTEEQVIAELQKDIPAGRFGQAEEIANVIAFLASPAASYINGVAIPVDGGRLACL